MGNDQKKPAAQTQSTPYHPDIIVVTERTEKANIPNDTTESVLNRLQFMPTVYPIIKSSIDLKDDVPLREIDSKYVVNLCNRLQTHLNLCADTVTFDQNALTNRVKELDFVANTLMHTFTEKQRKFAKYCDQFQSVKEISMTLKKIQRKMENIESMMKEINSSFPENERLEELSVVESK